MRVVESRPGQQEHELSNALHREVMSDGRNALGALHGEGFLKKVQTNQIIMTPQAGSTVRLDELNRLIDEIATGDEARTRMAEVDSNAGLVNPASKKQAKTTANLVASDTAALSDGDIATNLLEQAKDLEETAAGLLAESKRLQDEAKLLLPKAKSTATAKATTAKKAAAKAKV